VVGIMIESSCALSVLKFGINSLVIGELTTRYTLGLAPNSRSRE
jgi:hypothetical protein